MDDKRLDQILHAIESLVNTEKLYINQFNEIIKDHENRIRKLEKGLYIIAGIAGIFSIGINIVIAVLNK